MGSSLSSTEGATLHDVVATFYDSNPFASPSDFAQTTIDWGDGSASTSAIVQGGAGMFIVTGTKTYKDEGSYRVTATIRDDGGALAVAIGSARVADAPLTAGPVTLALTEGATFAGVVGSFTDANPGAPTSDYRAVIRWGDGTSSPGGFTRNSDGSTSIIGSHPYNTSEERLSYQVVVEVSDVGGRTTVFDRDDRGGQRAAHRDGVGRSGQ